MLVYKPTIKVFWMSGRQNQPKHTPVRPMAQMRVARMAGSAPDTLQQMGPFVGKTWLSGYEPTRVVLRPATSFSFGGPALRLCGGRVGRWRCCTFRWLLGRFCSGLASRWAMEESPFRRQGGESQGLRFFD